MDEIAAMMSAVLSKIFTTLVLSAIAYIALFICLGCVIMAGVMLFIQRKKQNEADRIDP